MVSFGGLITTVCKPPLRILQLAHMPHYWESGDAITAFQNDLFLGIEDRVVGMTFSEFGRHYQSNSSVGTDHGAAAPLFVLENRLQGGVLGDNLQYPLM